MASMAGSPIKVLLVEDSPIALEILQRLLSSSPELQIVGAARNGKQALELIPSVKPDVLCIDYFMERMDGLELTRQVMSKYPRPILIISNGVQSSDTENIFRLLQAGAVDVFPKPANGLPSSYAKIKDELINKIRVLAGVRVFTKPLRVSQSNQPNQSGQSGTLNAGLAPVQPPTQTPTQAPTLAESLRALKSPFKVMAIGSSTGGPSALEKILWQLPGDLSMPVICAQHISEGFMEGLVTWLDSRCPLKVKVAEVGERPQPGVVYFAPETHHLELDLQGQFCHASAPTGRSYCPSVDLLFKSIAWFYGSACIGILLTGMGNDGAAGMKTILETGGLTIAQDESTSIIFGMPREAIALGAAQYVLPLQEIAPFLVQKLYAKDNRP